MPGLGNENNIQIINNGPSIRMIFNVVICRIFEVFNSNDKGTFLVFNKEMSWMKRDKFRMLHSTNELHAWDK